MCFYVFHIISRIRGNVSPYPVNHSNLAWYSEDFGFVAPATGKHVPVVGETFPRHFLFLKIGATFPQLKGSDIYIYIVTHLNNHHFHDHHHFGCFRFWEFSCGISYVGFSFGICCDFSYLDFVYTFFYDFHMFCTWSNSFVMKCIFIDSISWKCKQHVCLNNTSNFLCLHRTMGCFTFGNVFFLAFVHT